MINFPINLPKKTIWLDCETGGTDERVNALVQLSAIIEIDGKEVDSIDLKMKPFGKKTITPEALNVQNRTMKDIEGFDDPMQCYGRFYKFLQKEPKSKEKRFVVAGYNPDFDLRFISEWFMDITRGPYEFWDYLQFSPIDLLPTLRAMRHCGVIDVPDTRLGTVCKHFGIELQAHDSMSDIRATREVTKLVYGKLFGAWNLVDKAASMVNERRGSGSCQECHCDALIDEANDIIHGI